LRIGDEIKMSVSATNAVGESSRNKIDWCTDPKTQQPPRIEVEPCVPAKPTASNVTPGNTVTIAWKPCPVKDYGRGIEYVLEWDRGDGSWTTLRTRSGRNSHRVQINKLSKEYNFRVSAQNSCSRSKASQKLTIKPFHVPVIGCPIVTVHMCQVHISWLAQSTGGASLVPESKLEYELMINKIDGEWDTFDLSNCE